jgi:6,7-dimethyl-8-ribityllumazine synthase
MKIGIVVSQWNNKITDGLYNGAFTTLIKSGVSENNIQKIEVPGSFELIFGAKIQSKKEVDAIICLGSIIQGETKHFDYVCQAVSNGIKDLNITLDIPVIFGVLTDNTMEQALNRSGGKHGNKGIEAAVTAIKMAHLNQQ